MKRKLFVVAIMALMVLSFATAASASVADELGPGTHSVNVDLYKATADEPSMGDPAILSPASVTVANGVATMTLGVTEMDYGLFTGYLEKLEYWNGTAYTDDGVVIVDNDSDDVPEAFIFPITAETDILDEDEQVIGAWQKVRVTVNVFGASMPVSEARLKIIF